MATKIVSIIHNMIFKKTGFLMFPYLEWSDFGYLLKPSKTRNKFSFKLLPDESIFQRVASVCQFLQSVEGSPEASCPPQ